MAAAFSYTVTDPAGFHARPAGLLVQEAQKFASDVTLKVNGKQADAKRIFGVMGLGVKCGDNVEFELSGDDEAQAAAALEAFCKENF